MMKQNGEIIMELFIRTCSQDELLPAQADLGWGDYLRNLVG